MNTIIVSNKDNNKKLVTVLSNKFKGLKINTLYKALRKKDIRINNIRISDNVLVHTGDVLDIYISNELLFNVKNSNSKLKEIKLSKDLIIYNDDNIIIVNKPCNIEVVGDYSLTSILSDFLGYSVYPCHRIDRNTTGLVLFAKNNEALEILTSKFQNHEIEKHYICTVYGIPKKSKDVLLAYLFKDTKKSRVYISDTYKKGYQKIITEYEVISTNTLNNTSTLDITLHTGKTHQIRAHLAHIGYPIIGDGKYGINSVNKQFGFKTQQLCSTSLKFKFSTDSGMLNYLNNKKIELQKF